MPNAFVQSDPAVQHHEKLICVDAGRVVCLGHGGNRAIGKGNIMQIMTERGWQALCPKDYTPAAQPTPYNGMPVPYDGVFPSQALCDYVNGCKQGMKYFDDGLRMRYQRPDVRVETDNAEPMHPILQPPEGF